MEDVNVEEVAAKKPRWSRKRKLAILGGVPLAIVGTTAAAAAIIAALAGITGGGTTGTYTAKFSSNPSPVSITSDMVVKAGSPQVVSGKLQLPSNLVMFPGESYSVNAFVTDAGSSTDGYISGLVMPGMPSGYVGELVKGCGGKFATYDQEEVTIKITAPATQEAGKAWTLSSEAGVQVTLGSPPAGVTCPVYTAP